MHFYPHDKIVQNSEKYQKVIVKINSLLSVLEDKKLSKKYKFSQLVMHVLGYRYFVPDKMFYFMHRIVDLLNMYLKKELKKKMDGSERKRRFEGIDIKDISAGKTNVLYAYADNDERLRG